MQIIVTTISQFGSEKGMKLSVLCIQHDGTTIKMYLLHAEYMPVTTLNHYMVQERFTFRLLEYRAYVTVGRVQVFILALVL